MVGALEPGGRAKVIAETADARFPLGTVVRVVGVQSGFDRGPRIVEVYIEKARRAS